MARIGDSVGILEEVAKLPPLFFFNSSHLLYGVGP